MTFDLDIEIHGECSWVGQGGQQPLWLTPWVHKTYEAAGIPGIPGKLRSLYTGTGFYTGNTAWCVPGTAIGQPPQAGPAAALCHTAVKPPEVACGNN